MSKFEKLAQLAHDVLTGADNTRTNGPLDRAMVASAETLLGIAATPFKETSSSGVLTPPSRQEAAEGKGFHSS